MESLLIAVGMLLGSGLLGLIASKSPRLSAVGAAVGAVSACLIGLRPTSRVLLGGAAESIQFDWSIPGRPFSVGLDALSAFFLAPIFVLCALAAVFGAAYMQSYGAKRSLGPPAFFFNLLVAGMVMVVIARNGLVFLMAWELMSLAAYFLVTFEHENAAVRRAGWVYLIATHFGAAFLFALFVLLGREAGSLSFDAYRAMPALAAGKSGMLFAFALVGFGAKAGFVPWHVWLPEAHPAAPSHVSAVMSGVMIKTGIYGILRVMTFLGQPAAWWGPTLVSIGLVGGLVGMSLALSQRDLKRALAYSSIENIGLVALGLGIGVWGMTSGHPTMAVLGIAGGLMHVWNHSLMKGLMFFAAGSVLHGTGTKDIERLGGVMQRMPRTGAAMILGAVAISGLPPLNGFVSEWLMYMGLMRGGLSHEGASRAVLLLSVGVVAIIGGLALACFVRIIGIVLLGAARSDDTRHAHESSVWFTGPMAVLGSLCVGVALMPGVVVSIAGGAVEQVLGISQSEFSSILNSAESPLPMLGSLNAAAWITIGLIGAGLAALRRGAVESHDATWGCGYADPTPRMQYTGTSFAEFIVARVLPKSLRVRTTVTKPAGLFPVGGKIASERTDPLSERVYEPFFARWEERFARLRWLQQGKIHLYLLYFLVVLVLAFGWVSLREWVKL